MDFALKVVRLVEALPNSGTASVAGRQLVRSATFVGANYRAACCARSRADFIAKMGIVHEECDEALYWLELLLAAEKVKQMDAEDLMRDAWEIISLTVASLRTARARANRRL